MLHLQTVEILGRGGIHAQEAETDTGKAHEEFYVPLLVL